MHPMFAGVAALVVAVMGLRVWGDTLMMESVGAMNALLLALWVIGGVVGGRGGDPWRGLCRLTRWAAAVAVLSVPVAFALHAQDRAPYDASRTVLTLAVSIALVAVAAVLDWRAVPVRPERG